MKPLFWKFNDEYRPKTNTIKNNYYETTLQIKNAISYEFDLPNTVSYNVNGEYLTLHGHFNGNYTVGVTAENTYGVSTKEFLVTVSNNKPVISNKNFTLETIADTPHAFDLNITDINIANYTINSVLYEVNDPLSFDIDLSSTQKSIVSYSNPTTFYNNDSNSATMGIEISVKEAGLYTLNYSVEDGSREKDYGEINVNVVEKLNNINITSLDGFVDENGFIVFDHTPYVQPNSTNTIVEVDGISISNFLLLFADEPTVYNLVIKVNNIPYQSSTITVSSLKDLITNTSTIDFSRFISFETFSDKNYYWLIMHQLLNLGLSIERLIEYGFNFMDFMNYQNLYATNLELSQYFSYEQAKLSFTRSNITSAWYDASGAQISTDYGIMLTSYGIYYKIYVNNILRYTSKQFNFINSDVNILYDLNFRTSFVTDNNIDVLVKSYQMNPKSFTNGTFQTFGEIQTWNTQYVTNMASIMSNQTLTNSLKNWDISGVTAFDEMFSGVTGDLQYVEEFVKKLISSDTQYTCSELLKNVIATETMVIDITNSGKALLHILKGIKFTDNTAAMFFNLYTTSSSTASILFGNLIDVNLTLDQLKALGFTSTVLYEEGFRNINLSFSVNEVKTQGLSLSQAKTMYSLDVLLTVYSLNLFKDVGFTALELKQAQGELTISQLIQAGYTDVVNYLDATFSKSELKALGYSAFDFEKLGYNLAQLRTFGYENQEMVQLSGEPIIILDQFQAYEEKGLENLFSKYTISHNIDTNTENTQGYTVTYNVTFDDNKTITLTRLVKVIDVHKPTYNIHINNDRPYKFGTSVTISVSDVSEPLKNVKVYIRSNDNIFDYSMTKGFDPNGDETWTYIFIVPDGKEYDNTYNVEITADDLAVETNSNQIELPNAFTIDNSAPEITVLVCNDQREALSTPVKEGDTVVIKAEFNEEVENIELQLTGPGVYDKAELQMTRLQDTHVYEYSHTVHQGDGDCVISITASDLAGNTTTNSQKKFIVDNTNPEITVLVCDSTGEELQKPVKEGDTVVIKAELDENVQDVQIQIDGANTMDLSNMQQINSTNTYTYNHIVESGDGKCDVTVIAKDLAGNEKTDTSQMFVVDNRSVPLIISFNNPGPVRQGTTLKVTVSAREWVEQVKIMLIGDESFSEFVEMDLEDDLGSLTSSHSSLYGERLNEYGQLLDLSGNVQDFVTNPINYTYTHTFTSNVNGVCRFKVKGSDVAGNITEQISNDIIIDNTPVIFEINMNNNGPFKKDDTVTVIVSAQEWLQDVRVKAEGTEVSDYKQMVLVDEVDLSGNTFDLSGNTFDLSGQLLDLSGNVIDFVTNPIKYTYTYKFTSSNNGICRFKVQGFDVAGNTTEKVSQDFFIDNIGVPFEIELNNNGPFVKGETVTVIVTATEWMQDLQIKAAGAEVSDYKQMVLVDEVDLSGNTFDLSGNTIDLSGNTIDLSGNTFDLSGQLLDLSGNVIDFITSPIKYAYTHTFSSDSNGLCRFTIQSSDLAGNLTEKHSDVITINPKWIQRGQKVDEIYGYTVSLNADGNVMAIGQPTADNNTGMVRVYEWSQGWVQIGQSIIGESGDRSGFSISLSDDGKTIAVGAPYNQTNGYKSGCVRVYEFNNNQWMQLGNNINGISRVDFCGNSVSLSANGKIVAIGSRLNDANGRERGHVRVFQIYENEWSQLGQNIEGTTNFENFGYSVSLSDNGQILAIGAPYNNNRTGIVKVYEFSNNNWIQLGSNINGDSAGDWNGNSVSLSADGKILAVGAKNNNDNGNKSGHVRIFELNNTDWIQLGNNIAGEDEYNDSGYSVSLSADGTVVAIGAPENNGNGEYSGHVRVYKFDGNTWLQHGKDIDGDGENTMSGSSVSLSADGTVVAIGSYHDDIFMEEIGSVRVFNFGAETTNPNDVFTSSKSVKPNTPISLVASNEFQVWFAPADTTIFDQANDFMTKGLGNTTSLNAPNNEGEYYLHVLDFVGNISTGTNILTVDGTPPDNADVVFNNSQRVKPDTTIMINPSGELEVWFAPADTITFEEENEYMTKATGNSTSIQAPSADGNYYLYVIDAASNVATSTNILTVDGTAATIEFQDATKVGDDDRPIKYGDNIQIRAFVDEEVQSLTLKLSGSINTTNANMTFAQLQNGNYVFKYDQAINTTTSGKCFCELSAVDLVGNVTDLSLQDPIFTVLPLDDLKQYYTTIEIMDAGYNAIEMKQAGFTAIEMKLAGFTAEQLESAGYTSDQLEAAGYEYSMFQLGNDIDGEARGDQSGSSISINGDGTIVAIGAPGNDGTVGQWSSVGHTRVYQYIESTDEWQQVGNDIDGENTGEQNGGSVSLSDDGTIVAVGSRYNNNRSGRTRIYMLNSNIWEQIGSDIVGEAEGDLSGYSVHLSADGRTVAIGAPYNSEIGYRSGHTRVYQYIESTDEWQQLGSDIDGEVSGDYAGWSVSLSANGTTVAMGVPLNDAAGNSSGQTRVYAFNSNSNTWQQLGNNINGGGTNSRGGSSVSLNDDGTIVAIGATHHGSESGHTRVYQYIENTNTWEQLGGDMDGEATGNRSGYSVSLSSDGKTVAIGAFLNTNTSGRYSGQTRIYQYLKDTNEWTQSGNDIDGENQHDSSGFSVSLSSNGKTVAIGAPYNDGETDDDNDSRGHTRVFRFGYI